MNDKKIYALIDYTLSLFPDIKYNDAFHAAQVQDQLARLIKGNLRYEQVCSNLQVLIQTPQPAEKIHTIMMVGPKPIPYDESSCNVTSSIGDGNDTSNEDLEENNYNSAIDGYNTLKRKKSRPWSPYEDDRLLAGILKYGLDNWTSVAHFVGNGRNRSQCSQRWFRGLDPHLSKQHWSQQEDAMLVHLVSTIGEKNWTKISSKMGNRSDIQCRYHYKQLIKDNNMNSIMGNQQKQYQQQQQQQQQAININNNINILAPNSTLLFNQQLNTSPVQSNNFSNGSPLIGNGSNTGINVGVNGSMSCFQIPQLCGPYGYDGHLNNSVGNLVSKNQGNRSPTQSLNGPKKKKRHISLPNTCSNSVRSSMSQPLIQFIPQDQFGEGVCVSAEMINRGQPPMATCNITQTQTSQQMPPFPQQNQQQIMQQQYQLQQMQQIQQMQLQQQQQQQQQQQMMYQQQININQQQQINISQQQKIKINQQKQINISQQQQININQQQQININQQQNCKIHSIFSNYCKNMNSDGINDYKNSAQINACDVGECRETLDDESLESIFNMKNEEEFNAEFEKNYVSDFSRSIFNTTEVDDMYNFI